MEVFDSNTKKILTIAKQLAEAGEENSSINLCLKCVKDNARVDAFGTDDSDILVYFYGDKIYNELSSVADAMTYIYIAKVAKYVYSTTIKNLRSANDIVLKWCELGDRTSSIIEKFFMWLKKENKSIDISDGEIFKQLMNALPQKSLSTVKMSSRVKKMTLEEIIYDVVTGNINYTPDGGLR